MKGLSDALQGGGRRGVDDIALALDQVRQRGLAQHEDACSVDFEDAFEILHRKFGARPPFEHPRNIAQHVEAIGSRGGDQRTATVEIGGVEWLDARSAVHHLCGFLQTRFVDIADGHQGTFAGKADRCCPANP